MSLGNVVAKLKAMQEQKASADAALPIDEVLRQIANRLYWLDRLWSGSGGWAPDSAAEMLSKARLDRLTALAWSLRHWKSASKPIEEGDLILAWTNLGALVEGALKLFLCVYLEDYKVDEENGKTTGTYHFTKKTMIDPDGLHLDSVIRYFEKRKLLADEHLKLARLTQSRRNVIHAFEDAELGTHAEFLDAVRGYRSLLREVSLGLPYPDHMHEPRETGPFDGK